MAPTRCFFKPELAKKEQLQLWLARIAIILKTGNHHLVHRGGEGRHFAGQKNDYSIVSS